MTEEQYNDSIDMRQLVGAEAESYFSAIELRRNILKKHIEEMVADLKADTTFIKADWDYNRLIGFNEASFLSGMLSYNEFESYSNLAFKLRYYNKGLK